MRRAGSGQRCRRRARPSGEWREDRWSRVAPRARGLRRPRASPDARCRPSRPRSTGGRLAGRERADPRRRRGTRERRGREPAPEGVDPSVRAAGPPRGRRAGERGHDPDRQSGYAAEGPGRENDERDENNERPPGEGPLLLRRRPVLCWLIHPLDSSDNPRGGLRYPPRMCGICGQLVRGRAATPDPVEAMTERLRHRGPDGEGLHLDGPVALGHRRLKIIDLTEAAAEPMTNEDGSLLARVQWRDLQLPRAAARSRGAPSLS